MTAGFEFPSCPNCGHVASPATFHNYNQDKMWHCTRCDHLFNEEKEDDTGLGDTAAAALDTA